MDDIRFEFCNEINRETSRESSVTLKYILQYADPEEHDPLERDIYVLTNTPTLVDGYKPMVRQSITWEPLISHGPKYFLGYYVNVHYSVSQRGEESIAYAAPIKRLLTRRFYGEDMTIKIDVAKKTHTYISTDASPDERIRIQGYGNLIRPAKGGPEGYEIPVSNFAWEERWQFPYDDMSDAYVMSIPELKYHTNDAEFRGFKPNEVWLADYVVDDSNIPQTAEERKFAAVTIDFKSGTIWHDGNQIYSGIIARHFQCTGYLGVIYDNVTSSGIIFFNGDNIHEGSDLGHTLEYVAATENNAHYAGICSKNSNAAIFWHDGGIIYSGQYDSRNGTLVGCGAHYFGILPGNGTSVLFYDGIQVYSGPHSVSMCCDGGEYYSIKASDAEHISIWYKGSLICDNLLINYGIPLCCGDYLFIETPFKTAVAWHKGSVIFDGECISNRVKCCDKYLSIRISETSSTVWYDGSKIYEGGHIGHTCCSLGDYFSAQTSLVGIAWYKGAQIYDGAMTGEAACCTGFLVVTPSMSSTIVFAKNEQFDSDQEKRIAYRCCVSRMYSPVVDKEIDIFDQNFGKMKFNINTFSRIA